MKPDREMRTKPPAAAHYWRQWALNQWRQRQLDGWLARWRALHLVRGRGRRWRQAKRRLQHAFTAFLLSAGLLLSQTAAPVLADGSRVPAFTAGADNPYGLTNVGNYISPSFADLDGDGDLDAFVGEEFGNFKYFQNTGSAAAPAFAAAVDNPFGLTDVGYYSSPSFADLDGDGDLDAFVGESAGNFKYFQNTGSVIAPAFAAAVDNPFGLADVGALSVPSFADLDGDGDLDAFVGESAGNIKYFHNTGSSIAPAFAAAVDNPFGLADVGIFSAPTFADLDGDGDLDAFVGEYYGNFKYFQNTGSAAAAAFAATVDNPFGLVDVGLQSAPAFADLDGDGDLDAFVGEKLGNIKYFQNGGTVDAPTFGAAQTNPNGLADVGLYSAPSFADLDGDGDLDAFVGEYYGNFKYFQNTGSAAAPAFAAAVDNPFGLADVGVSSAPTFADLDGDGDLDAFAGESTGNFKYFQNTGSAVAPAFAAAVNNPFGLADVGLYSVPSFADLDADGDLDAFVGEFLGNIKYFQNTGSPIAPAFAAAVDNPFGLANVGFYSAPSFADLDADGDLDALVAESAGNIKYFQNTGSAVAPAFAAAVDNPFGLANVDFNSIPTFVDIGADGDLDAFMGNWAGNIIMFHGAANNPTSVTLQDISATSGAAGSIAAALGAMSLGLGSLWLRLRRRAA